MKNKLYQDYVKRILDIVLSFIVLIVASPIMIIVGVLIKIESPGKIFYRQDRIGKNGQVFQILKFRSMYENTEHTGIGVYSNSSDTRVTKMGKFIRATSIDELPQLWNVIGGKMSLIGPRPPLTYHPWPYNEYTAEQKRMFEVRPGITGWAQINGRKQVEWHERIKLNVWYVDNVSLLLDIKIFFKTIYKVLFNSDNNNDGKTV